MNLSSQGIRGLCKTTEALDPQQTVPGWVPAREEHTLGCQGHLWLQERFQAKRRESYVTMMKCETSCFYGLSSIILVSL